MYKVKEEMTLMDYLLKETGKKRNALKNALKYGQVFVNGAVQTNFAFPLHNGDEVTIGQKQSLAFPILYEDEDLIVINKPSGLVSEQTMNNKSKTAYAIVKDYLTKKHEKIFLVHRLDQETSGVLMFVKKKALYEALTKHWNDYVKVRSYVAIVEGKVIKGGTIKTCLQENKAGKVYVAKEGKQAITHYQSINSSKGYTMMQITIDTGRKNQIRVHMAEVLHHPISGDVKYGGHRNTIHRLALHQDVFAFVHPLTHKEMTFSADVPEDFYKLVPKNTKRR